MSIPSVVLTASTSMGSRASSVALTITGTVQVNDVVYVQMSVFSSLGEMISSVSCTGSTNAQVRPTFHPYIGIQVAWATISTMTVNPVFTIHFPSANDLGSVCAIVVRGAANPTAPFDAFPGIPMIRGVNSTNGKTGYPSSYNNDSLLIFGGSCNSNTAITEPSGWTRQTSSGLNSMMMLATKDAASPTVLVATMTTSGASPVCCVDAIAGQAFSAPSIPYVVGCADGGSSLAVSTISITFMGTFQANDVAYVMVGEFTGTGTSTISSVSCDGSSNATARHSGFNNALNAAWATISSPTTNPVFTVHFTTTADCALTGIIVRGAKNPTSPFDSGTSLPAQTSTATATFTTSDPNALLIFGGAINNAADLAPPSGWTLCGWSEPGSFCQLATMFSATAVSGLTAIQVGGTGPFTYADAISDGPGVISFPHPYMAQRRHRVIR